mmetsp:Transcript_14987/g.33839  ORF Transcript_14987/g.33839 Transcript_14987/m.33839 type:complete len:537 (-) Transcript_14987:185-1795(-)
MGRKSLAPDATALRMQQMEANRVARRAAMQDKKRHREEAVRRNAEAGNPGDLDFVGMVTEWRNRNIHLATANDRNATRTSADKIQVCVRKRPLNDKEKDKKDHDAVTVFHPTVTVHSPKLRVDGISKYIEHTNFRFDHTFGEGHTTEKVYDTCASPLIDYACAGNGNRATIFAYGQTGSGKTYTMSEIQRRAAEGIFVALKNNASRGEGRCSIDNSSCSIAIFEIYGGRLQDLLNNRNRLKVLEDGKGEVVISELKEMDVSTPQELLSLVEDGLLNRTTHATEANDVSSRSHAICQIFFRDKSTGKVRGKLTLVDLAGSERGTDTKQHNRQRRTESSEINTSLLALKECIRSIESVHVPYRQSKLTLILKDCFLSNQSRTCMIATLSPGSSSTDHTINTLRYADRIKEQKVGTMRSPPRSDLSKNSPRDKSDEANPTESSEHPSSEMDQTVKALFEEEELLLGEHMQAIHESAELLTEEGQILSEAQGDNPDMEEYAHKLDEILERKHVLITSLRVRLRALSNKGAELGASLGRSH